VQEHVFQVARFLVEAALRYLRLVAAEIYA
jgi:hypothetical protein